MEYSRHGAVLKGLEKAVARSKYEEDVLTNNHTVRTTCGKVSLLYFCHIAGCISHTKSAVHSVSGGPTGKMASGDTSAAALWSNKVTAPEKLELVL